jgi:peptidoglycan/LPS O-acetylase OafA/YrhL
VSTEAPAELPVARTDPGDGAAPRRVLALDGLRGLAISAVLLFHAGALVGFHGGYLSVDLFFVLSGFLITGLLVAPRVLDRAALWTFWQKRARRLLPALFCLFTLVAVYARFAYPSDHLEIRERMWATLCFGSNLYQLQRGTSYWDLFRQSSPLEHTWSLAVEEQFYLVWPLLIAGLTRWVSTKRLFFGVVAAWAASTAWALGLFAQTGDGNRIYLGTDTRMPSLLLGAALAVWMKWRRGEAPSRAAGPAGAAALAGILLLWVVVPMDTPWLYGGMLPLCAVLGVLVIRGAHEPGLLATVLEARPLREMGARSYGLYLFHWPLFVWLRGRSEQMDWAHYGLALSLSLGLALVSERWVERPFLLHGLGALRRRWLGPLVGAATVVGVLMSTSDGEAQPEDEPEWEPVAPALLTPITLPPPLPEPPAEKPVPVAAGPISRPPDRQARLMIMGDSVAHGLGTVLVKEAKAADLVVLNDGLFGCPLFRGDGRTKVGGRVEPERAHCAPWRARWLRDTQRFKPDAVFLLWGGVPVEAYRVDGEWRLPCDDRFLAAYQQVWRDTLDLFGSTGAALFVALPAYPRLTRLTAGAHHDCEVEALQRVLAERPAVRTLALGEWTCPNHATCTFERDGVSLSRDGIHYDVESGGAKLAADWVLPQVIAPR